MKVFKGNNFVGMMEQGIRIILENYGKFRNELDISFYTKARKPPVGSGPIFLTGKVRLWVAEITLFDYKKESITKLINVLKEKDKEKQKNESKNET
jgi:hypothetical protein